MVPMFQHFCSKYQRELGYDRIYSKICLHYIYLSSSLVSQHNSIDFRVYYFDHAFAQTQKFQILQKILVLLTHIHYHTVLLSQNQNGLLDQNHQN